MNDDKKCILWIHGFCGRPNNEHFLEMQKHSPQYEWYSIEVDHHALASMEKINDYIRTHDVCLVAGTSLGGYYAMCADFNGSKLVVNPVMNPVRDLRQFLGTNTYKPGRPDGQTDFEFTEEMLMEFGKLKHDNLANVLCHFTAHDPVLGEDIKKEYEKSFYYLKKIDEKLLPGHFLTFNYAKATKELIPQWIEHFTVSALNPYNWYGAAYELLPKHILPALRVTHSMIQETNWPKLLLEVETCIKDVYDTAWKTRPVRCIHIGNEAQTSIEILLEERKHILREMFHLSQETFEQFKVINDNLLDLHNRMVDKMAGLYASWLTDEEEGWRNNCQVKGRIIVEQTKEDYPDDGTGSDYERMMEIMEELSKNKLIEKEFSGQPGNTCDQLNFYLEHGRPTTYFSVCGEKSFGNFRMCSAFQALVFNSPYAPQDVLRIAHYWCDVALVHQRITNEKGDLQ